MSNFFLAFRVVFPLMTYMLVGYLAKRLKAFNEQGAMAMNNIVFFVFMPLLLFENVLDIDLTQGINVKLCLFAVGSILISFCILCQVVPRFEKADKKRGVMIHGIIRSNYILFGLAVARSLWGDRPMSETAMLIAVSIPLFNILGVLSLELFRSGEISWVRILRNMAMNPLIEAAFLGIFCVLADIRPPELIMTTISTMGRAATPMALAALGGYFRFEGVRNCLKQLVWTVVGKLIIMPVIWLSIAALMGFRGLAIISLLPLYGAPAAVSSYTMALQMDGEPELASQVVVYTGVFSLLTVFALIVVLKGLQLF